MTLAFAPATCYIVSTFHDEGEQMDNDRATLDVETVELSLFNRKQRLVDRIDEGIEMLDALAPKIEELQQGLAELREKMAVDSDKITRLQMQLVQQTAQKIADYATQWLAV